MTDTNQANTSRNKQFSELSYKEQLLIEGRYRGLSYTKISQKIKEETGEVISESYLRALLSITGRLHQSFLDYTAEQNEIYKRESLGRLGQLINNAVVVLNEAMIQKNDLRARIQASKIVLSYVIGEPEGNLKLSGEIKTGVYEKFSTEEIIRRISEIGKFNEQQSRNEKTADSTSSEARI